MERRRSGGKRKSGEKGGDFRGGGEIGIRSEEEEEDDEKGVEAAMQEQLSTLCVNLRGLGRS